ncbi:MAG: cytochrome c oxidase subunit [Gaiellaceae bacterium]|nr:cytochrome c oxidase subunit [Gaiellaceae bacterium]MDX6472256.1 cytochrome c oxidase subunit [Gaiellaceae bacterium]
MSAADAAAVARARRGPSTAVWGMAMFVATEATLFALMTGSYFYLRFKNLQWPPPGIPEPKVVLPLGMLALLLATGVPVQLAARAGRGGRLGAARAFLVLALAGQAAYLGVSIHEYASDLTRFGPGTHAYGSIYYTLLGADHAHVGLGLLFSVWLLAKLARGLTLYRLNALQAIAFYWQAVNVLTVVVTLTVLSPAL